MALTKMTEDKRLRDVEGHRLNERLRRLPSASSVPNSLPVLFFGDLLRARAASIGINPSGQEYLDGKGGELTGPRRRFETLSSLGAAHRSSLTDDHCRRAIQMMRGYFEPAKPVYGWFRSLDRVIWALGYSYQDGEAAHLDLVQEATDPTWSGLKDERPQEADALLRSDLPFRGRSKTQFAQVGQVDRFTSGT